MALALSTNAAGNGALTGWGLGIVAAVGISEKYGYPISFNR